ncbi:phospholipase [Paludibacter sp. 221]|uniref:phospholipase n=1 Tax=Paludibacter sp. 221 TaxID=2302939 RepID=UPI0013D12A97|nr:phospholipase [Paludibacter sp. 221]NDV46510.1 phospholipase [Paludibacter sp. 221]
MLILIIILIFLAVIVFLFTYLNRRNKTEEVEITPVDSECCGAHEVCEKESLLNSSNKVVYYDDEELDALSGKSPSAFTKEQINQLSEVFYTLRESDVAGWLRSLQMRQIELPDELKEEALLIVRERRGL